MSRRAPAPEPEQTNATQPAQERATLNLDEPAAPSRPPSSSRSAPRAPSHPAESARDPVPSASTPAVPLRDADRVELLAHVIEADLRFDPRAAYDELRKAERSGTSMAQAQLALDEVLHLAALASRLACYARREARLYREVGYVGELAALREEARKGIGPRTTKEGAPKAIPAGELDDWVATHKRDALLAIERRKVDLDEWATHAERYAAIWQWRGADLRRLSEAAQVQGDLNPDRGR